jgi:diamine N-acetyltransferase
VTPAQWEFVTEVSRYLLLCHYGEIWHPLAVYRDETVIGFLMWGVDPADGSCRLGGILIDQAQQGRGYGRAAVQAALDLLAGEHGHDHFALSYNPANAVAKSLYAALGFIETNELVDDEVVARLYLAGG